MGGPTVTFLGKVDDATLLRHYQNCRALVFPTFEDFGLTPLEAQACGRPVVALGRGGATETVVDGSTGVLFDEQTAESMAAAMQRFETMSFDGGAIRQHALRFDKSIFMRQLQAFIEDRLQAFRK